VTDDEPGPLPEAAWWGAIALFYGPVCIASSGWLFWTDGLGVRSPAALGAGLLIGAMLAGVSQRLPWTRPDGPMGDAFRRMVGPLSLPAVVALAAFSAVGEELFFRGILQPWLGLWPTAILFGLVHIPPERALWSWPLLAFGMGVLLGLLTQTTQGLGMAIGVHFALNLLNLHALVGPGYPEKM
jgi:membrane protease YdiL (CAAX protease family)